MLKSSHCLHSWNQALTFLDESIPEKKKLTRRVVRFSFNLLMTRRRQRGLIVAQHCVGVPRYQIVTDFMSLAPSLFQVGCLGINQDAPPIGQQQSLQAEFPYHIFED